MNLLAGAADRTMAKLRVLLLEDSPSDAAIVVEELRSAGYDPEWTRVQTEEEFQANIDAHLDLILADFTLPQFDALDALEMLQARGLSIPFIIVTGTITEETAVAALKRGADDFLLKDRLARLGPAVTVALQQHQLREDRRRALQLLMENEDRYRRLVSRMSALIIELDPEGKALYVNEAVSIVTGFSLEELLDRNAFDLFFPQESRDPLDAGTDILSGRKDLRNHVARCRIKDGSSISLEWNTANQYAADGRLQKITALGVDISDRERAELRIRQLSRLYAAISKSNEGLARSQTPDELFGTVCRACVEHGGFILAWVGLADREVQRIVVAHAFGPAHEYVDGLSISTEADDVNGRGPTAIAYRGQRVYICNDFAADPATAPWRERAAGYGLKASISLPIRQSGETIGALAVYGNEKNVFDREAVNLLERMADNISFAMDKFEQARRRKELEAQETADAQRLSELSRRVVTVQEEERRRLATELHDRTSPNLSAVALNFAMMAEDLPRTAPELLTKLTDSRVLLEETVGAIRDVCADLRPATLEYAGVLRSLQQYAKQFSRRTGIVVNVSGRNSEQRLPSDKETTLFRIAQEALTNCAKHAKASAIDIEFSQFSEQAVLTIVDNGAGFESGSLGQSEHRPGLGLLSMRERAEFAGGKLSLESHPGKGTHIRVEI